MLSADRSFRRIARLAVRFGAAREAAVAPLVCLLMIMVMGCMGVAIDTSRSMVVKARLVSALDAAGLAIGARIATTDFSADALRFVRANFKANYAGATVNSVTATVSADQTVISLAATATMPTSFMKLLGSQSVTVKASTEITRASDGLELVLVLDNTGSMDDSGSMPTLKTSSKDLVNLVFGSSSTAKNLYVGLVPFSATVNIGASHTDWINPSDSQVDYPGSWLGCVEARNSGLDQTDDIPKKSDTKTLFNYYYFPYIQNNYISYADYRKYKLMNVFCPQEITQMTSTKATVTAAIDKMVAGGNTHINLGAVWGWRLLSPTWRGTWDGADMKTYKLPLSYTAKNMRKAIVLMTDGDNTMSADIYTAYGSLSEGNLGTTNDSGAAEKALDTRLSKVCTSMKAKGVVVYTVAFNNPNASTKALLEGCATGTAYYFDAGDQTSLNAAFKTIGASLSNLRVSR